MEIRIYKANADLYVELSGRIVLDECDRLKKNMLPLIEPTVTQFHLDLSNVEFLDSAGLGVLVGLKMTTNKNKTRLILVAPSKSVHDILFVSKLDAIFDIMTGQEARNTKMRLAVMPNLIRSIGKEDAGVGAPPPPSAPPASSPSIRPVSGSIPMPPGAFAMSSGAPPASSPPIPAIQEPARAPLAGASNSPAQENRQSDGKMQRIEQHCREAVEFMRQGDYDRAAESYSKAVELDPDYLPAHNNLAIVYEKKPTWHAKALAQWEKVHDLSQRAGDQKHMERASKHLANLKRL